MNAKRILPAILGLLLLLFTIAPATFAETPLPDGAVKGLPERLAALDDEGNPVNSETGEYFFHVENMTPGMTYTKKIQLANLREDQGYHIFFCVEPLSKAGDIDLEAGCLCTFFLDDVQFYAGSVNGDGNIDLTQYYDCGSFAPGEMHVLRCEIVLSDINVNQNVDNGWTLVDRDGAHVLREPEGEGYAYGEIEFKWIFCARVETPNPGGDTPKTGLDLNSGLVWLIGIAVVAVLITILLILIKKQKTDKQP